RAEGSSAQATAGSSARTGSASSSTVSRSGSVRSGRAELDRVALLRLAGGALWTSRAAWTDDHVERQREEALAAIRRHADRVGDAAGLVAVDAPHPRDEVERHPLLEHARLAGAEAHDVALVPARRERDAD